MFVRNSALLAGSIVSAVFSLFVLLSLHSPWMSFSKDDGTECQKSAALALYVRNRTILRVRPANTELQ
ncbi:exported hypothetical protein [Xenorhabdus innexi]|uniref:Uncharacterized protein n=1 Tax=Xenorhabdus innexi TaxID=290109 RepID=A0A1N6MQT2_9GAMM|nr:exported hypothetical protein [Xenorhabdus innexi]